MLAILRAALRRNHKLVLFFGLGLGVIATLFSALFQQFSDQITPFAEIIPEEMRAVIGDLALGTSPEGWLGIELFPLIAMVGLAIVAIVLGAGLIGREEESGTLELLLASRVSRARIVAAKYLALALLLLVPPALLFAAIALLGPLFDFYPNLARVVEACGSLWMLGLAFGGLAFAAQAVGGRRGVAIGISSGVFLTMYALKIASKLIDSWKDYNQWSLIHYYNIPGTLIDGIDWLKLIVLVIISLLMFIIALGGFVRRDTGV